MVGSEQKIDTNSTILIKFAINLLFCSVAVEIFFHLKQTKHLCDTFFCRKFQCICIFQEKCKEDNGINVDL